MELIQVNYDNDRLTIMGRELHEKLEIGTKYNQWFEEMCKYGFIEGEDFLLVAEKRATNNPKNPYTKIINHQLTLDMAKEIAMIQRTPQGKQFRQYFIQVEKQHKEMLLHVNKKQELDINMITQITTKAVSEVIKQLLPHLNQKVKEKAKPKEKKSVKPVHAISLELFFVRHMAKTEEHVNYYLPILQKRKYIYRHKTGKLKVYKEIIRAGLFQERKSKKGCGIYITEKGIKDIFDLKVTLH